MKIQAVAAFVICGALLSWGCADSDPAETAFTNDQVGTAGGPEGPTDVQVIDFEDGVVPTADSPGTGGIHFATGAGASVEVAAGGAGGSARCLRLNAGPAPGDSRVELVQRIAGVPIPQAARANSHQWSMRSAEGEGSGDVHLGVEVEVDVEEGEVRSSRVIEVHSDGDTGWRTYRAVRLDYVTGGRGARMFEIDGTELWSIARRGYWQTGGSEEAVLLDDLTWFYQNPFLAAFPSVGVRWVQAGDVAVHPVVVWNTHPSETRSFRITPVEWWEDNTSWAGLELEIVDLDGSPVVETRPLSPGEGFVFQAEFRVPQHGFAGAKLRKGDASVLQLYVAETTGGAGTEDAAVIGILLETRVAATTPDWRATMPATVETLRAVKVGETWARLRWTEPEGSELAFAYAIRYSETPITDEASWLAAVPAEGVPRSKKPGAQQSYTLRGLKPETQYYTALRYFDESGVGAAGIASVAFVTGAPKRQPEPEPEPEPEPDPEPEPEPDPEPEPEPEPPNGAPVIEGVTPDVVQIVAQVGEAIRFEVVASDPEGDALTAAWRVSGWQQAANDLSWTFVPEAEQVGVQRITVEVTDGQTRENPTASWEVVVEPVEPPIDDRPIVLVWDPPTQNADGSQLEDLGGFKLHYGERSREYVGVKDVGKTNRFDLTRLPSGSYFVSLTAYDVNGNQSGFASELFVEVP